MSELILPAGFGRRLAAAFYDGLLLCALFLVASLAVLGLRFGDPVPPGDPAFRLFLLAVAFVFNAWFWTHGGQTLGMRAWRLQVRHGDHGGIGWGRSLLRFAVAVPAWGLACAGVIWCMFDPRRRAWQDWASDSDVVVLPRPHAPRPDEA